MISWRFLVTKSRRASVSISVPSERILEGRALI
jgi:hypothetical protein